MGAVEAETEMTPSDRPTEESGRAVTPPAQRPLDVGGPREGEDLSQECGQCRPHSWRLRPEGVWAAALCPLQTSRTLFPWKQLLEFCT